MHNFTARLIKSSNIITDNVVFQLQPRDMFVNTGETVIFECVYEGSRASAFWEINNRHYHLSNSLPQNHHVHENISGSFLTIDDVDSSLNGNTYRCIVISIFSNIGHLYVLSEAQGKSTCWFIGHCI